MMNIKLPPLFGTLTMQRNAVAALLLLAAFMLIPHYAYAYNNTPIDGTLCQMVGWMTGKTGRAIATLAIIIIGVGALMGKVSWGMAIIVALGVALVFGANDIVGMLGGSGAAGCTAGNPSTAATY